MGLKLLNVLSSQSGLTYGRMDYLDFIKRGECVCKLIDLNLHSYRHIDMGHFSPAVDQCQKKLCYFHLKL